MTSGTKIRFFYLSRLALVVTVSVALFSAMVYLALNYFWYPFWGSMALQLAVAVLVYKLYRWWR